MPGFFEKIGRELARVQQQAEDMVKEDKIKRETDRVAAQMTSAVQDIVEGAKAFEQAPREGSSSQPALVEAISIKNTLSQTTAVEALVHPAAAMKLDSAAENTTSSSKDALHLAASKGDTVSVQNLVAEGANVNTINQDGDTPLHLAVNAEIANILLKAGADFKETNKNGETPLHTALSKNYIDIMQVLSKAETDFNMTAAAGAGALTQSLSAMNLDSPTGNATSIGQGATLALKQDATAALTGNPLSQ